MSRLLLAVAVAAILVLVGAFVPVNGRTLVERWNAAPSAAKPTPNGTPSKGTATRPAPPRATSPEPVENHSDEDRKALDRIVAEHAADRPAPPR
jgi:hypothetical protein